MKIIQVFCDQTTDGGRWTVFQRRIDGSVNFFQDWDNYKNGFGQLQNEFWLGNENIFTMLLQGLYARGNELRIDLMNLKKTCRFAKYKQFHVSNEISGYSLHIHGFSGTATDSLTRNNRQKFTTFDIDNDIYTKSSCAVHYFGGWWFDSCYSAYLNGKYYSGGKMSHDADGATPLSWTGIHWHTAGFSNGASNSLIFSAMKVRRNL